LLITSVRK